MKLAAMLSGGKDSMFAAYLAKKSGHTIDYILSMISENPESYMFHTPNIHLLDSISKIMEIPIIYGKTKGVKEEELADLKDMLNSVKGIADGITTGAIASNYQRTRIEKICGELGLECISPFWGQDPETVFRDMLKSGFKIMIVAVGAPPLDEKWLGRIVDNECIDELVMLNKKHGINITFEGGEAESLVLDCPLYKNKRIEVEEFENNWDPKTRSGHMHIKKIRLVEK